MKGPEKVQACKPLERTAGAQQGRRAGQRVPRPGYSVLDGSPVNDRRKKEGKKPANLLLLRDASDHLPSVVPFRERYGVKGVALVEMPAEVGIARLLGMKEVLLKDHKDLARKAESFKRELAEGRSSTRTSRAPTSSATTGTRSGRRRTSSPSTRPSSGLYRRRSTDARIAVSCDHATPCVLKSHSSDPVPLMVTTSERDTDCCRFTEGDAKRGSLGTLRGTDVLSRALSTA